MNAIQLRKNLNSKTVAMLVFGACENHGDHMPFGSDFFVPMELAKRVAARAGNVLVLPAFPYGVSLTSQRLSDDDNVGAKYNDYGD